MLSVMFFRVRPDREERLRSWMAELARRAEEVRETFAHEGVRHEIAFLIRDVDGPLLVFASESVDTAAPAAIFRASSLPIDVEHRAVMAEVVTGAFEAERLSEVSA